MRYITGTKLQMVAYQRSCDKALGLPRRGRHVGGGRHVELGDTPGPGWTTHYGLPRRHPAKELWAHPVLPTLHIELAAIPAPDATALVNAEAESVELGEDWEEPLDEAIR